MWPDEPFQDEGGIEEEKGFINEKASPCLLEEDREGQQLVEHEHGVVEVRGRDHPATSPGAVNLNSELVLQYLLRTNFPLSKYEFPLF